MGDFEEEEREGVGTRRDAGGFNMKKKMMNPGYVDGIWWCDWGEVGWDEDTE